MTVQQALGWALVHSLWQEALAAAALASLLALIPLGAARLRYALATTTLLLMLALPLATGAWLRDTSQWRIDGQSAATAPTLPPAAVAAPSLAARVRAAVEPTLPWIVLAWFGGVLALSVRLASGWAAARRLRTAGTRPVPEACRVALARLAARLSVSRPVRVLESALVRVPAVIGWLRPVILVPASALTGLTPLQLDALLAHELAHVRRYDYLVNLLQSVIETLLFYHPTVWWVSRRVREERENCCDDLAVGVCGDARCYATALLGMERLRIAAPALAASGGSLMDRIQRLVAPASTQVFPRGIAGVVAVALTLAIGGGIGLPREVLADRRVPTTTDPRALATLISVAWNDPDADVQREAVETLAEVPDGAGRVPLVDIARTHPNPHVRREAVKELGKSLPRADAARVLAAVARQDPDEHVQRKAVEALGEIEDGAGLPAVIDIARTHANAEVRREAVETVGDAAPPAVALKVLTEISRLDRDRDVRRKAVKALAKLRDR